MPYHQTYDPNEVLSSDSDDDHADIGGDDMGEQDDEQVEEQLRQELERLRGETTAALKKSWAEVEQLQSEGAEGKEKVNQLERELDALRAQQQAQQQHQSTNRGSYHHGDDWSTDSSDDERGGYGRSNGHGGGGEYMAPKRSSVRGGQLVTGAASRSAAIAAAAAAAGFDDDDDDDDEGEYATYSAKLNDADEYAQQKPAGEGRRRRRFSFDGAAPDPAAAPAPPALQRRSSDYSQESGVMYGRRLSSQHGTDTEQRRDWKDENASDDDDAESDDWQRDFETRSQDGGWDNSASDGMQSQVSESALDFIDNRYGGFGGGNDSGGDVDARSVGALSVGAVPTEPRRDKRGRRGGRRKKDSTDQDKVVGGNEPPPGGRRFSMERSGSTRSLAEASLAAVSNMLHLDGDSKDNEDVDPEEAADMDMHDDQREKGAIELGLAEQLTSLDHEKQNIIDEMQTKLKEKESDIENMERTTSQQAQQISLLQAELEELREQVEEVEKQAIVPDMSDVRAEIKRSEAHAAVLERQVSDAEYRLEARKEREQVLSSELAQIEANIKAADEDAAKQLEVLKEQLRKANASRAKYEEENRSMRQETDDILAKLRTDLYEVLAEEAGECSDAFADLMSEFQDLREKEEELGKVLVLRMQERGEVVNALEAIKEIRNRTELGQKASQEVMQKLISSLNSINFDNKVLFSRFAKTDERTEAMKQRHQDAISTLEALGEIQTETNDSLGFVQEELLERLAALDWNKQQTNGSGNAPNTASAKVDEMSAAPALEDAERTHKEAKARLDAIRDDIRSKLIGSSLADSQSTLATSTSVDDEEDEVFRLEEEISSKDAKIESLQSTAEKLTEQIASLKKELSGIEDMGNQDKSKSVETLERLQKKVEQAAAVSSEREKEISTLQTSFEEKKKSETALESELASIKEEEALHSQQENDDMPDEDLPAALDHVGL